MMTPEAAQHYQHEMYQRVAELDCWGSEGMSLEERYQREADFALKASELRIMPDDFILDLASGAGGHARRMETVTHANIDARDISKKLIMQAKSREFFENIVDPIRKTIDHQVGDMMKIEKLSLREGKKYRLITILGSSFIFLHTREKYVEVLRNLRSLLEDGGKIVVQYRVHNPNLIQKLTQDKKRSKLIKTALREENPVTDDRGNYRDQKRGDSFYCDYSSSPEIYDPSLPIIRDNNKKITDVLDAQGVSLVQARNEDGTVRVYQGRDGISHMAFDRIYTDKNGTSTALGVNNFDIIYRDRGSLELLQDFFREAGFHEVQLKSEVLSPNDKVYQVAVVAKK